MFFTRVSPNRSICCLHNAGSPCLTGHLFTPCTEESHVLLGGSGRGPVAGKLSPPGQKEGSDLYIKSYNRALPLSPGSCLKASLGDVLQPSGVRAFLAQSGEWLEAALPQVADKPCMQTYHPQLISRMSSKQGTPRPATFPDSPVLPPPRLPSCLSLSSSDLCV